MDKLQLVTYEQAQGLKKLKFAIPVKDYYHPKYGLCEEQMESDNFNSKEWAKGYYSAPSLALAAQFLREAYGLHVCALQNINNGIWRYRMTSFDKYNVDVSFGTFDTHDIALSHGLTAAIEVAKMRKV